MNEARRRWLVPEVVQTSAMDCGPAALKALLEGFGIPVSYGRLREACQTDVDGTSIDTLEDVLLQLGLDAEQTVVPGDQLLRMDLLPALVVVRLPSGFTHFVVVWGVLAGMAQVMDPALGRRWMTSEAFLRELYVHEMEVPSGVFLGIAGSHGWASALDRRLATLGAEAERRAATEAIASSDWRTLAGIDAVARMVEAVARAGGLRRGRETAGAVGELRRQGLASDGAVASEYWSVRGGGADDDSGEPSVRVRGAVVLRVRPKRSTAPSTEPERPAPAPLSPELVAALEEPPARPLRRLWALATEGRRARGIATWLGIVLVTCTLGRVAEVALLRALLDVGRELGVAQQRIGAVGALIAFLALLLALEIPLVAGALRIGRRLEARLRVAFLEKVPRLGDRYFATRPVSDMAERSHAVHTVRGLPDLVMQLARTVLEIVVTVGALAWLAPSSAVLAVLAGLVAVGVPLAAAPLWTERDLRLRNHRGALARFHLDALLAAAPIHAHRAERSVAREHESLLVEWARAGRALVHAYVQVDTLQSLAGTTAAAWLLVHHVTRGGELAAAILLAYWALNLPALGQELASLVRQLPERRNTVLRLLEPLGAREEEPPRSTASVPATQEPDERRPASLAFEGVTAVAGGHAILQEIDLRVAPGEHVAILGASGAGKSSLVGLLLGWHRAAEGRVLVDGRPLDGAVLGALRESCVWVDPSAQLWNRSVLDNVLYGAEPGAARSLPWAIEASDLTELLDALPLGLQTTLGEGGALVSGGEGQRVRLGRALLRSRPRLVLLDEPFRGLDRERRHALLDRVRGIWKDATLLCITHDVGEAAAFDRVVVVHEGRVVEDAAPGELAARDGSRYLAMLGDESATLRQVWADPRWRRVRVDQGRVVEGIASLAEARATSRKSERGCA